MDTDSRGSDFVTARQNVSGRLYENTIDAEL